MLESGNTYTVDSGVGSRSVPIILISRRARNTAYDFTSSDWSEASRIMSESGGAVLIAEACAR